jgi:hypothetical protein
VTVATELESSQEIPAGLTEAGMEVLDRMMELQTAYNNTDDHDREVIDARGGMHAYRYEIMEDDSVIAIWTKEVGHLNIRAFDDMREASAWSPRDE